MHKNSRLLVTLLTVAIVCVCCHVTSAQVIDIPNTQPAAFDQPQVNAVLLPAGGTTPYQDSDHNFNAAGFLDTGSSGIVIDSATADLVNLPKDPGVKYFDIGVGGNTLFDVSQAIDVRLAPSNATGADDITKIQTVYNQAYSSVRAQLGPTNVPVDPFGDPIRVYGMPTMLGKTVVMDPKPLNGANLDDFLMHTYVYNAGTPFDPAHANTNPGIPSTSLHVPLSYASFDQFTQTTPAGATPPTTAHNPFIGPNPLDQLSPATSSVHPNVVTNPPPVSIDYQGLNAQGSFLLDTGAAASFISSNLASQMHVQYKAGTQGTDNPQLVASDGTTLVPNQFQLQIQGVGGTETLAGFFLDHLLLHTTEGATIRFVGAPVLIEDITVQNSTGQSLTLDGIFGMNFLVLSFMPDLSAASDNPFNWITFDEPNGLLGLDIVGVPEPGSIVLAAMALVMVAGYVWRRRAQS